MLTKLLAIVFFSSCVLGSGTLQAQSSLFDSTELSNQKSGVEPESADDPIEGSGFLTSAYRAGEATRVGINYLPLEFKELVFCTGALLGSMENEPALAKSSQSYLRLKENVGVDLAEFHTIVRGWMGIEFTNNGFGTLPSLLVAINNGPIDQSEIKATKIENYGFTYYRAKNGMTLGFPKDNILVLGTANEVLNALRMKEGKSNDRQPGLEWLAYLDFDSVRLVRARNGVASRAFFTKEKESGTINLFLNEGLALFEKDRLESHLKDQGIFRSIAVMGPTLISTDGRRRSGYHPAVQTLDKIIPTVGVSDQRFLESFKSEIIEKFEKKEFHRGSGTRSEESFLRSFTMRGMRHTQTLGFSNVPLNEANPVKWVLDNTSSRVLRSLVIQNLADSQTGQAIMLLGLEAHRFDLRSAETVPDAEDDDLPAILSKSSRPTRGSRQKPFGKLPETLDYYLKNPGDPILLTAACKIAGDLKLPNLRSSIEPLAATGATANLKEAASQALASIDDKAMNPKNLLVPPADGGTALRWLGGTERAKKAAALVWVMRNSELDSQHSSFVSALAHLLDDGLYYQDALVILKKICKPGDAQVFRDLFAAAESNSRTSFRQEHTIIRIAEMLLHLKDREGVKLAYSNSDYDLSRYLELREESKDIDPQLQIQAKEDLVASFLANPPSESLLIRMSSIDLTDAQKRSTIEWAKMNWQAGSKTAKNSRFWTVVDNCEGNYQNEDCEFLVEMIFRNSGLNTPAVEFLSTQSSDVESLILGKMNGKLDGWAISCVSNVLMEIGTEKCIPFLEKYNSGRNERSVTAAIEAIRKRR